MSKHTSFSTFSENSIMWLAPKSVVVVVIALLITIASSQNLRAEDQTVISSAPILLGEKLTIQSNVLGEERELQIYLPPNYEHRVKSYPVIYVFDGDFLFQTVSAVSAHRAGRDLMPESIIVGIPNNTGKRLDMALRRKQSAEAAEFNSFGGKTDDYVAFLRDEVISLIDSRYRTNTHRIIIGMSPTNGPVYQSFWDAPELFQGHIALAAGVHFYLPSGESIADRIVATARSVERPKSWLYIGRAGQDVERTPLHGKAYADLAKRLEVVDGSQSRVLVDILEGEEHYGMALPALSRAFSFIYPEDIWNPDYLAFRISEDPASDLRAFYVRLSAEYGFDVAPMEDGYWTSSSVSGLGRYFVRQTQFDKAVAVYQLGLSYYPNSVSLHYVLSNTYEADNQHDKAIEAIERAVAIAEKQKHVRLSYLENRLNALQGKREPAP